MECKIDKNAFNLMTNYQIYNSLFTLSFFSIILFTLSRSMFPLLFLLLNDKMFTKKKKNDNCLTRDSLLTIQRENSCVATEVLYLELYGCNLFQWFTDSAQQHKNNVFNILILTL